MKAEATKRAIMMATRVASNANVNGDGGKSDGDGKEGVVASDNKGDVGGNNCGGNEGGK